MFGYKSSGRKRNTLGARVRKLETKVKKKERIAALKRKEKQLRDRLSKLSS